MTTTIAFIGLGIMGKPMAINLVNVGFDVVGFNLAQPAIDALVAAGGRGAASIGEAVKDADIVAIMVPDSPDVEEVLTGVDGVFVLPLSDVAMTRVVDAAGKAGIPVVGVDTIFSGSKYAVSVWGNNQEPTYPATMKIIHGKGNVLIIRGIAGETPARARVRRSPRG